MVRTLAHVVALPLVAAVVRAQWPVEALGIGSTTSRQAMDVSLHLAQGSECSLPRPEGTDAAYMVVIQQFSILADGPFTFGSAGWTVRSAPEPAALCVTRPFDAQAI